MLRSPSAESLRSSEYQPCGWTPRSTRQLSARTSSSNLARTRRRQDPNIARMLSHDTSPVGAAIGDFAFLFAFLFAFAFASAPASAPTFACVFACVFAFAFASAPAFAPAFVPAFASVFAFPIVFVAVFVT